MSLHKAHEQVPVCQPPAKSAESIQKFVHVERLVVALGLEIFAAEFVDESAKLVSINSSKTLAAGPAVGGISIIASRGGCATASIPVSALSTAGVCHVVFEASVGTA